MRRGRRIRLAGVPGPWLRVKGGTVVDPSPGVGLRPLAGDELGVALLASVEVRPVPWREFASIAPMAGGDSGQ